MASTTVDRRIGVYGSAAIKLPARTITTANITLSGLQTVNGVALVAGDRVLVKEQTNGVENGIYEAGTGDWLRAKDFNGIRDIVQGTLVSVLTATTAGLPGIYEVRTADPIIGTSALTFGLHSALYPDFDVLWYGAVGDGTTDDTAAIQSAIDASVTNNRALSFVGAYVYRITEALDIPGSLVIYG